MATTLQLRRGDSATVSGLTGAVGEVIVNTTKDTLTVHDGSTQGGHELVNLSSAQTLSNKTIGSNLLPSADSAYDLGSSSKKWKSLYLSGSTIFLGDITLKDSGGSFAAQTAGGEPVTISLANNTTTDLAEGNNLYYTKTRVDSDVTQGINALIDGAPAALNTLNELAAALNDDSDFAATVTNSLATKLNISNFDSSFDTRLATKTTDNVSEGSNLYYTSSRFDSDFADQTTDNLTEGSNLYYTTLRVDSDFDVRLATKSTDNVSEGSNLYYTRVRFDSDFADQTTDNLTEGDNLYYTNSRVDSAFDARFATKSTNNLAEGTNQYFTTARARASISVVDSIGDGSLTYNSGTGVLTYIGPSASEVRAHFSGGTGVTITDGVISIPQAIGTTDSVTFAEISVNKITDLSAPIASTDAANKAYVDEVAEGLLARPSVRAATTANLDAFYDSDGGNSNVGYGALIANADGLLPDIDSVSSWSLFDGILVKSQTDARYNGRYVVTVLGNDSNPWELTRCGLCDSSNEVAGSYMFVTEGALYANTGWVLSVADPATFTINEDDITVIQFSGAGSYTAGTNLSLNGTQFNLDANITLTSVTATTVTATDFNSTSDVTLKENVSSLNNVLETINSINPVEFTWKDTGNKAYGVIAQEIENVLPEIVSQDENGIKSVNYIQIIAFLVKAVQEQQKEIELIKSKI